MDITERLRWSGQDAMTKHLSLGMAGLHTEAANEIDRLRKIETAARALVEECNGGAQSPSLGVLAKLESALTVAWWAPYGAEARRSDDEGPVK